MRQVLGPLRTARRNTTTATSDRGRPLMVEDDGPQGWLDRAACRDVDPERFFPASGEQLKAAEAKAICAGCQVRDHCLDLAVKAAGGLDPGSRRLRWHPPRRAQPAARQPLPRAQRLPTAAGAGEAAHALTGEVGLRQAARQLGIHRDALRAAFAQWGLPALERRVGWQPSRFCRTGPGLNRTFALGRAAQQIDAAAEELGDHLAVAAQAFQHYGLGGRLAIPEAVRQHAIAATRSPTTVPGRSFGGPTASTGWPTSAQLPETLEAQVS